MALGTKAAFERRVNEFRQMAKRKPELRKFVEDSLQEIEEDMSRLGRLTTAHYAFFNGWLTGVLDFNS